MTEREKMLAGELYDCGDAELLTQWHLAKDLMREYNCTRSDDLSAKERILDRLLGGHGRSVWITHRHSTWITAATSSWAITAKSI